MKIPKTFAEKELINVIIETPKGSRNKYTYQPGSGLYELTKILPAGTCFPFDFGFIPHTIAEDGDPLDAFVLVETKCFPGCIMKCRVIGALTAEQKEKGKRRERNDRIVAVPVESIDHSDLKHIRHINKNLLGEVIHFFKYYNKMRGKEFKILEAVGPEEAIKLIKKHIVK